MLALFVQYMQYKIHAYILVHICVTGITDVETRKMEQTHSYCLEELLTWIPAIPLTAADLLLES
jgi:hypothetical protein